LQDPRGNPGEVRWATYSFELQRYIGIAVVDKQVEIGELLDIDHPNGQCQAVVCKVPFIDRAD